MSSARGTILHLLQYFFKSCSFSYCLPYRFNKDRGFHLTESKWALFLWKLNTFACLLWAAFTVGRMIQFNIDDSAPTSVQLYMRLIAPIPFISLMVVQVPTWKSRHDIVNLAVQIENFFVKSKSMKLMTLIASDWPKHNVRMAFTGPNAASTKRQDRILLATVSFIQYGSSINTALFVGMVILRPQSPEMLTSLLYSNENIDPTMKAILWILTILLTCWALTAIARKNNAT